MRNIFLSFFTIISLQLFFIGCSGGDQVTVTRVERSEEMEDPQPEPMPEPTGEPGVFRDLTSMQLVAEMPTGWNLGNSLDVPGDDETAWGNPITSREMIDKVRERGFGTLRVPVTWGSHTGNPPEYTIETTWMDHVEEIVNYGLDNDMYVILNIHHDNEWTVPTPENASTVRDRLGKVWTQIANRFRNYSDFLLFEVLNEPRHEGTPQEWNGGTAEERVVLNQYLKTALDAIRATGGNNEKRHIMIPTYAASTHPNAMNDLVIPNNDQRTIVSVHTYFPFQYALLGEDRDWGTDADRQALDAELDRVRDKFIANGIPVIMGEFGSVTSVNDRLEHATYYANGAVSRGMLPIWWDDGGNFRIFNRRTLTWISPDIADAVINAKN
ncbi:glycoside hydrolase family 5 protein [Spongiimicrobium salis]|uniref:glycoside hydrolase family 5 protein n=1 Tax=Spongiimicrobium salis TaxID=1667022 RepID=UPI00374DFAC8